MGSVNSGWQAPSRSGSKASTAIDGAYRTPQVLFSTGDVLPTYENS